MTQPRLGDPLGAHYRFTTRIGVGAAGDVWRIEHHSDPSELVAKILKPEHAADHTLVERFIRERSVLITLRHPSIVAVRDFVVEGNTLAIVMDYIPGGSLRDVLKNTPTFPTSDALMIVAEIFDALTTAHEHGVTHRDIKPDNVLLASHWEPGARGTVRVTDFGIAGVIDNRDSHTTGLLGTPLYMPPELITQGQSSSSSDIYSTGILLYELLSGHTPFAGPGTDFTIAYRHVAAVPPPLELPDEITEFVCTLLTKKPEARPSAHSAARTARSLAQRHTHVLALEATAEPPELVEIERSATVLRKELFTAPTSSEDDPSPPAPDLPELGEAGTHTVLRPMTRPRSSTSTTTKASARPEATLTQRWWRNKKALALAVIGGVLVIGLGVAVTALFPFGAPKTTKSTLATKVTASHNDDALPSGMATTRTARFDPTARTLSVEFTFSAQKADLDGELLEVLPPLRSGSCPAVTWTGATATRNLASTTGIGVNCGWQLTGLHIPHGGRVTATANLAADTIDEPALSTWLDKAASLTQTALSDPNVTTTAYPIQRLVGITMELPERTVSQTTLAITLLPVWPSGVDTLNPLYRSPSSGSTTEILRSIAGGESGVRFSDTCGGAVAVTQDGLSVTALSMTPECRLRATVGNFTDLESPPFSITTRE